MQKKQMLKKILAVAVIVLSSSLLKAQTTDALGTYTPYSLFGIGEIEKQGTALNRGMGGIGVAVRDNRFINYLNPAAITARDTLSFMLDFGVNQKNFYNSDGDAKSAYNTFNMQNIIFTAPIYKKSALIVGITPYSNIGYKFQSNETNNKIIADYGNITYQKYGTGSINQFFFGSAMNLSKNIAIGAEFIYYFGSLNRNSNIIFGTTKSARTINTGWDYSIGSVSGRFGAQYFGNVAKNTVLTLGATYRLKTKLKGDYTRFAYAVDGSATDTVMYNVSNNYKLEIPSEFTAGVSIKKLDKWLVGFDYSRQNWEKSATGQTPGIDFKPSVASSYKLGFEFIPNKYDIRYYMKRVTYRAGAYYEQTYINLNGRQVNAAGFTFGMSFPIYRWYNAINWAVDVGQRGSLKNQMVRETYFQFVVNISLHDMWFIKKKYQ